LEGAPRVRAQQRHDLAVDIVHLRVSIADFMPLHGIDHVEFYVGNALQATSYWVRALGFKEVAYAGLETGVRDRASHVLEQGRIRIVLTGALVPDHEIGAHVAK